MEKVGGITFFRTRMLQTLKDFYQNRMRMDIWLDQGGCIIFRRSNLLLGFCEKEEITTGDMITLFYPKREDVDRVYDDFKDIATCEPKENSPYNIYQFFAVDPEGRDLEFQAFLHPIDWQF